MTAHCSPIRISLLFCLAFTMSYKEIASKCFSKKEEISHALAGEKFLPFIFSFLVTSFCFSFFTHLNKANAKNTC